MDLTDKLIIYRLKNKISQQKLANQLDVSFSTVNRWLNSKSIPNQINRYQIKNLLEK